jgi:hypothetical protein
MVCASVGSANNKKAEVGQGYEYLEIQGELRRLEGRENYIFQEKVW